MEDNDSEDDVGAIGAGGADAATDAAAAADAATDAAAAADGAAAGSDSEEEEQFDITLAASHSYMGAALQPLRGRVVLEAGWRGRVPCLAHHGAVFPGETVPMLLPRAGDAAALAQALRRDKLFGLLCPDESGAMLSGYGVLCEVFEAALREGAEEVVTFKARAVHRFRALGLRARAAPLHAFARMRAVEVRVLPELAPPAARAHLASLAALRHARQPQVRRRVRRLDAAPTAWPAFVHELFDYRRARASIQDYFSTLLLDKLPSEPVSLSFWVASNLALSARDRLALFCVDCALLRLHMEARLIARKSVLCCAACVCEIARREHIFAMSSEGVHSNYTNLGGYVHDLVTVSAAANTALSGAPSAEYSWFPGYTWTVALCAACMAHVGWRFDATRRALRPQQFYGLCRNYVQPRALDAPARAPTPPHALLYAPDEL